jgi:hypothetical protein
MTLDNPRQRLLTESQVTILQALAEYKFLSAEHVARLLGKNRAFVYKFITPGLCGEYRPLARRIQYPVNYNGSRPYVFYITINGVKELSYITGRPIEDFKIPKVIHAFEKDYDHRMAFLDTHIGLRMWLAENGEAPPSFFVTYFDRVRAAPRKSGGELGFRTATHVQIDNERYIEPDGITRFSVDGKERLCVIEMHCDRPPGEIVEELNGHIDALEAGTVAGLYNHPTSQIVLSVHENPKIMQSVIRDMRKLPDFDLFAGDFMFNTLENVRSDFSKGWTMADGKPAWLFG